VKFGAVIAAAGLSSRMGGFKPLLPLGGTTIIEKVIKTLRDGGVEEILVVTGRDAVRMEEALSSHRITFIFNKDYASTDMFYSASLGLAVMAERAEAVFFTPADVPLFTVNTVRLLAERLQSGRDHIVVPVTESKQGHPIVMLSQAAKQLIRWKGGGGLKGALEAYSGPKGILETGDPGILLDADTPEDYRFLMEAAGGKPEPAKKGA
jgi:CTP:molybdopterin cytidylyltransferase MocA